MFAAPPYMHDSATPEPPPDPILRVAMVGMIEGNGHPYSWSAIINGYDAAEMDACPYPVIPKYLGAQPAGSVGVAGVRVTHIWTDNPTNAVHVAKATHIEHRVTAAEDVIGSVDAVLLATDDGFDHVQRALPFIAAGLPVFVDKPLSLTTRGLRTFVEWHKHGAKVQSSSGLRFAPELDATPTADLGDLRWIAGITCKNWERYGIHALEPIARLLGPGFLAVRLESLGSVEIAHLKHRSGVQVTLPVIPDGSATFATFHLTGTGGQRTMRLQDTYTAFRRQLLCFFDYVRTGRATYPFTETIELMCVLIAGLLSRAEQAREVSIEEIRNQLSS